MYLSFKFHQLLCIIRKLGDNCPFPSIQGFDLILEDFNNQTSRDFESLLQAILNNPVMAIFGVLRPFAKRFVRRDMVKRKISWGVASYFFAGDRVP